MTVQEISENPSLTLLSQSQWSKIYPRTDYGKTSRSKEFVFHWLLALNQSDKVILPHIQKKVKERSFQQLSAPDGQNKNLTPLMIATMRGRFNVVKEIIAGYATLHDAIPMVNMRDAHCWTALHHAAISSKAIYEFLLKNGADTRALTDRRATPRDILNLTDKDFSTISSQQVSIDIGNGILKDISMLAKENLLTKETGLIAYRDIPYYGPDALQLLWCKKSKSSHADSNAYQRALLNYYNDFLLTPPRLLIKPCDTLEGQGIKKFGLYSHEKRGISSGKMITTYSGQVKSNFPLPDSFKDYFYPPLSEDVYVSSNIDASQYGNAGRFANWGWPNAILFPFEAQGSEMQALIAIEPIGYSEEILWDYGVFCTNLGFGNYKLLGREKMHAHFLPGLKERLSEINSLGNRKNRSEEFEQMSLMQKFTFPLNTPAALLDLHFSDIVHAKEWFDLVVRYDDHEIMRLWESHVRYVVTYIRSYLLRICAVDEIAQKYPLSREPLKKWVLGNIGTLTVMQILKGFDHFIQKVNEIGDCGVFNWEGYLQGLSVELKDYCWLEDDHAPLNESRVRIDIYNLLHSLGQFVALYNIEISLKEIIKAGMDNEENEIYRMLLWVKEKFYNQ